MKRTKNHAYIACLLIMILFAVSVSGCGKENSPVANPETAPAEDTQTADKAEDQAVAVTSSEISPEEAPEAAKEHSATDGLTITNNEMYDGERKVPVYDTLYATLKDVEIWGEGDLDIDVQPEGTIIRRFIVKNKNTSPITFRMESLTNKDIVSKLSDQTGYQFTVHPNGWNGYIEPGEEYELSVDVAPERLMSETDYEGPLDIHLSFSVAVDGNSPEKSSFTAKQNIKVYSRETFSNVDAYKGMVKGTIRDEDGNPIAGAVVRGASEYSIRRVYAYTDAKGEFTMKLPAFKTTYANAWKESQICVKKNGYNARQIIVYPKEGKEVSVDMTLFPETELLKYEEKGVVDLKLQGYENTTDGNSIIAYIPFHTGQKSSAIKDRIQVSAVDYDGNLLFEYPIPEEVPYIQGSRDGKYIVTVLNSSADQSAATGWKTVILDREGKEVYSIDHYPVEDRDGWPSESQANNSISRCAGISNSDKYLFTSNAEGNFWLIDWQNDKVLWQDYIYGQVRTIDFSEDDSLMYVSSGDGYYRCYTIDGELVWKTFVGTWITKTKFTNDAIAITTKSAADTLKVLDRETGEIRWTYPTMQTSLAIAVSPDGKYLWYGGHSSSAFSVIANSVFDMETGQILYSLGYENAIAGAFSGDGSKLAVSDRRGVYVYNASDGAYLWSKMITDEKEFSFSFSLAVNNDGSRIVATANTDKSADYYGQAYFFSLAGPDEDPLYDFNRINPGDDIDLQYLLEEVGYVPDPESVTDAFTYNANYTLSEDSTIDIDTVFKNGFTIDCAGHDLTITGRISLFDGSNKTATLTNVGNLDLSGLEFYRDPTQHIAEVDMLFIIKGENLNITYPEDVLPGSRSEKTKGFFYEEKDSNTVFIKYG